MFWTFLDIHPPELMAEVEDHRPLVPVAAATSELVDAPIADLKRHRCYL